MKAPVIITRPAPAGPRLLERLRQSGRDAVWWPAFTLGPAPDREFARATLARLDEFDLAIFVSPAAVRAVSRMLERPWPRGTTVGAVGAATAAAVRERLGLPGEARVIAPAGVDAGSEAFWAEWTRRPAPATHVLILRAQHGREWLGEQFAAAGATVTLLPVYTREETALDEVGRRCLGEWVRTDTRVITVFSSSEAVDSLERQIGVIAAAPAWLRNGWAIATHERVAARLLAVGYRHVELSSPDDDILMARLESI